MTQLVVAPDALAAARKWLTSQLPDLKVVGERPATLPKRFVILRESGGGRPRAKVIMPFYLTVEAWDDAGTVAASELARTVAAAFTAWEGVEAYTASCTAPVYNPDTETRRARYTFAVDGTLRGTVITNPPPPEKGLEP